MATQRKPRVIGPFEAATPPEDVGAPPAEPPKPKVNELTPSPELLRKMEEEERLRELRDESGEAAERSRRASMGTLPKEPVKKEPVKKEPVKKAAGGYVKAADGCAQRGKTKGRMV